ncbi:MAG: tetratricopeptide repeat protein [bacterium]
MCTVACTASRAQEGTLATALKASYEAEASGDYAAAIKPLTALGAGGKASYIVQLRLGWLNTCARDWKQGIEHYQKASKLAPFAIEPLLGKIVAQQAVGLNEDAIETAQAVLRQDPNNYKATLHLASLLYLKKDFKQAAVMYRKLANLYPTDTEVLLGLGYTLTYSGDKKGSAPCFHTVLLLSPNNTRAVEGLRDR